MIGAAYQGLRIEPTLAATRELIRYSKDLCDIVRILEDGYACGASKRKQNIVEKCIRKGNKELKAVVAKTEVGYPDNFIEQVWRLIHFGIYTYKPRRRA